jgi:hypothetical protein
MGVVVFPVGKVTAVAVDSTKLVMLSFKEDNKEQAKERLILSLRIRELFLQALVFRFERTSMNSWSSQTPLPEP